MVREVHFITGNNDCGFLKVQGRKRKLASVRETVRTGNLGIRGLWKQIIYTGKCAVVCHHSAQC